MELSSPIRSIIPSSHGLVLAVLARTGAGLTGRGVAELVGDVISRRTVSNALRELVAGGVVLMESRPPANVYRLNHDHVAAPAIVALASQREELIDRMRRQLAAWKTKAEAVWLFGSFARGEGDTNSDIDVFVIRPDRVDPDDSVWMNQVVSFSDLVERWSGNDCSLIEYSAGEFDRLETSGGQLVEELGRDGIHLAGRATPRRTRLSTARQ